MKGGSKNYVSKVVAQLGDVRLGQGVQRVLRDDLGVAVTLADGSTERFDRVILACHADEALAMLGNPSAQEREILGAFRFQENRAVLHTDASLMPVRRGVWSAWNYLSANASDHGQAVAVTYWMNRLQSLETAKPLLVTLNPLREPKPSEVLLERRYTHPQFDAAAMTAQERLGEIQGTDRLYFCGAWSCWGFHEDGIASAVKVARLLGITPPWHADTDRPEERERRAA